MKQKSSVDPEWMRVDDAAIFSGLSRTHLFRAIVAEEIESLHVKKPGAAKGIRLVNRSSLLLYLRSFAPGGSRYQQEVSA
jgi:hypothetical protein